MVYVLPHGHRPVGDLVHALSGVAQIGCAVDQQAVAGGRAERVDHDELPLRVFFPQALGGQHSVLHRGGHAGAERDMQHVALLQQRIEEGFILEFVQLRGGRQLSLVQKAVESRQRRRVAAHIVLVADAVDLIGVEQHGDPARFAVGIGQIDGGLTRKNEACVHIATSIMLFPSIITAHGVKRKRAIGAECLYAVQWDATPRLCVTIASKPPR